MSVRPCSLIIPKLLLVAALGAACTSLPAFGQPAGSGSAQAGTATSGPGRLVTPEDMERAQRAQPAPSWAFDAAAASDAEKTRAAALLDGKNPRQLILEYLQSLSPPQGPPALSRGALSYVGATDVLALFRDHLIYVLRFRQWPLSVNLPPPIQNNNIFVIDKSGDVSLINRSSQLSDFFTANVRGIKSGAQAYAVASAWMALSEELAQDGMFRFSEPVISVSDVEGLSVSARADVEPNMGNQGEVTARIVFTNDGGIQSVVGSNKVRAGMRPICQSTKLLDSDPIVRKMAEQDLLLMGKSCKSYLDEQRAKAQPELQAAIDRIWQRIIDEDRN
jgi:hypothetical protein